MPVHFLWFKSRLDKGHPRTRIAKEFSKRFGGNETTIKSYLSRYFPENLTLEQALWEYRKTVKTREQRSEIARRRAAAKTPEQRSEIARKAARMQRYNLVKDVIYVEELPYKEIAEVMKCPIGTVMSRLFMARQCMKKKMVRLAQKEY